MQAREVVESYACLDEVMQPRKKCSIAQLKLFNITFRSLFHGTGVDALIFLGKLNTEFLLAQLLPVDEHESRALEVTFLRDRLALYSCKISLACNQ